MAKAAKNLTGVYQLYFPSSGECFIGSSASIHNTYIQLMHALLLGLHPNKRLQLLWSKTGPSSCSFSFLEITQDRYSLLDREKFWLDKKKAHPIEESSSLRGEDIACSHISIQKDLRDEIRNLRPAPMSHTIDFLVKFYKDHSKE